MKKIYLDNAATTPIRQEVIERAFAKFDIYNEGKVSAVELEAVFNCPQHPKVVSGELTTNDVFVTFLSCFSDKHGNGRIGHEEWTDSYASVSAQIESDDTFVKLMTTTWRL